MLPLSCALLFSSQHVNKDVRGKVGSESAPGASVAQVPGMSNTTETLKCIRAGRPAAAQVVKSVHKVVRSENKRRTSLYVVTYRCEKKKKRQTCDMNSRGVFLCF